MEGSVSSRTLLAAVVLIVLVLGLSPGFSQVAVDLENRQDFFSAIFSPDSELMSADSGTSRTGTGQPPRFGPNVRANAAQVLPGAGRLGRSETTIAATEGGQHIVVGFNDAQGFCGPPFGVTCTPQNPSGLSGYAYSSDGGLTWTDGAAPPQFNNVFTRGDPWLDRGGSDGNTFYYANLAVHAATGVGLGISVHRGHFRANRLVWEDVQTFNSSNPNDFYDKEALAAAKDGSGHAVVSLTNFIELCGEPAFGFGQIEVWRTMDGGNTWLGPVAAGPDITFITDPANLNCGLTGTLRQSSAPAIGPNGEVYVVSQRGPTFAPATSTDADIVIARSLNGGMSFEPEVKVADINSMRQNPPVGYNRDRINDHPRVAVATSGPHRGRVYVVYSGALVPVTAAPIASCPAPLSPTLNCREQRLTSSQVFVRFSDDQGATWSSEMALAPTPSATGLKRWWPVVSVEPGGNVDVIYYESQEMPDATNPFCTINVGGTLRRRGPANSLVDTFWVRSTSGGASFSAPMRVSTTTTNWCTTASNIRPNFGDYIGSLSGGNRVLATWADGRNGVPDTFYSTGLGAGKSGP